MSRPSRHSQTWGVLRYRTGATLGLFLAAWAFATLATAQERSAAATPDAAAQNQRLGRGVNIIGYDPLWKSQARARFQDRHFALIKEAGFKHVRINLHPFRDTKLGPDNKLSEAWLATLDWAVKQALANRLLVILDFHEFNSMGENPEANKNRFLAVWRQIAARYKDQPSDVLFEILNEPNKKLTPELWNQYLREALAIIRQTNPTRTVVIGPASWNSINFLEKLELPENDRQLIVTVHYYNPFAFTHQGAPWTGNKDKLGVLWTGTESEQQAIVKDFAKAQTWATQHRRPIYLGEFGAYEKGDLASRVRWTSFVTRHAESLGWSWGYWQFDGDFIVYDMQSQKWVEPIREALLPAAK